MLQWKKKGGTREGKPLLFEEGKEERNMKGGLFLPQNACPPPSGAGGGGVTNPHRHTLETSSRGYQLLTHTWADSQAK